MGDGAKSASKWCSWKTREKNIRIFADDEADNDDDNLDVGKMLSLKNKIATWNKLNTLLFVYSPFSGPSCSNVISGERKNCNKKIEFTFVRSNSFNLFDLFLCEIVVQFQRNMKLSVNKFHSQAAAGSSVFVDKQAKQKNEDEMEKWKPLHKIAAENE